MITVIGKLKDTANYRGIIGFNVMPVVPRWTPKRQQAFLDQAIARGDQFLIVSNDYSGEFLNELIYLLQRITENKQ